MHTNTSGRTTATTVTLTEEECDLLFNSSIVLGFFNKAEEVALNRLDRSIVDSLKLALKVADAVGVHGDTGGRTIDDPEVIDALRQAITELLDGRFQDEEFDGYTPDQRPIAISIERKLDVDRFQIAAQNNVQLDEHGTPEDRRESMRGRAEISWYTRKAFSEVAKDNVDRLDERDRAWVTRLQDLLDLDRVA